MWRKMPPAVCFPDLEMKHQKNNQYQHLAFDEVDSTNAHCLRLAMQGERQNTWVTAKSQSAGKGRRGRTWVSQPGNLFASLLLINPCDQPHVATLPFVVAIAVSAAIDNCINKQPTPLSLKWPNDVLFSGKKISGILLEATMLANGDQAVIIGVGVNCQHAPDDTRYPASSLAQEGCDISPESLFAHLRGEMHKALAMWDRGLGFAAIRHHWLDRATGIGSPIIARFDDHEASGIFVDIDNQGLLVLETDKGTRLISAADIFFGNCPK